MPSRSMRRGGSRHRHWVLVGVCVGLGFLPTDVRKKARSLLLDAHAAVATRAGLSPKQGPEAPSAEVRLLRAEVAQLGRALNEAGAARELVSADDDVRVIPADVLPLTGEAGFLNRIALARGSVDGVRVGLPVIANDILIGRIGSVTRSTSEVLLATDPSFSIRATLPRGEQDVEGMLRGDGSETLVFEPVVLDDTQAAPTLVVGETVVASRASVLCSVRALIGSIERVEQRPGDAQPRARIQPACDLSAIERVVVVRSTGDDT